MARKMNVRRWAATALVAACWSSVGDAASLVNLDTGRIDAVVKDYMAHTHTPAISVYVDQGGTPLLVRAWGKADVERNMPASPDVAFEMGSISKSVTAHAVLQLVVSGKLSLTDKVTEYLPACAGAVGSATIQQLLTHTAGAPDYMYAIQSLDGRIESGKADTPELAAAICAAPLEFASGSRFRYSNSNYYLLGLIIEKVTGRSYADFVEQDVIAPLGVGDFRCGEQAQSFSLRAAGYAFQDDGSLKRTKSMDRAPSFSAGCWVATASTLGRYRRAVFTSALIDPRVRNLFTTTTQVSNGATNDYVLGGMKHDVFNGQVVYRHSGGSWGQSAFNAYYPERDLTIVVMSNENPDGLTAGYVERGISRIIFGIPAAAAGGPVRSSARFVGRYIRGDVPPRAAGDPPQYQLVTLHGKQLAIAAQPPPASLSPPPVLVVLVKGETFAASPYGLAPEPEENNVYRFGGRDPNGHAATLYVGDTGTTYSFVSAH
jgi:CubicO group peptidase (beta-lactamase class C family)